MASSNSNSRSSTSISYFNSLNADEKQKYFNKLIFICGEDPYELPRYVWTTNPDEYPTTDK